jgi:uncharacterized membrane protein YhaH (DUF805 family)
MIKCATFSGRAPRAEFWWFTLAVVVLMLLLLAFDTQVLRKDLDEPTTSFWPFTDTATFLLALPSAAVAARRLQDVGLPGWPAIPITVLSLVWIILDLSIGSPVWIAIITIALFAALYILALLPSQKTDNTYGPNPHEVPS